MAALVNCRACGVAVSDEALTCPRCGHPLRDPDWKRYAKAIVLFALILFLLSLVGDLWNTFVAPRLGSG